MDFRALRELQAENIFFVAGSGCGQPWQRLARLF